MKKKAYQAVTKAVLGTSIWDMQEIINQVLCRLPMLTLHLALENHPK